MILVEAVPFEAEPVENFLWEVEAVAGVAFSQIVDSEEFGCPGNAFHADGEDELGGSAGGAV